MTLPTFNNFEINLLNALEIFTRGQVKFQCSKNILSLPLFRSPGRSKWRQMNHKIMTLSERFFHRLGGGEGDTSVWWKHAWKLQCHQNIYNKEILRALSLLYLANKHFGSRPSPFPSNESTLVQHVMHFFLELSQLIFTEPLTSKRRDPNEKGDKWYNKTSNFRIQ